MKDFGDAGGDGVVDTVDTIAFKIKINNDNIDNDYFEKQYVLQ